MITLENVSKIIDGQQVLQRIDWDVQQNENWVLFGLNGSGKTTLLNIITGYLWPTTGTVNVLGKEFGTYPLFELRKQIGFVSSTLERMLPSYDYAENIVLSGKYATLGIHDEFEQEDIDFALSLMGKFNCSDLIHRPFETLSQGQKQKVTIMRALMAQPKLLILDEPCNGLDILAREQVLELIDALGNEGGTPSLLYVTHHIEEIMPTFSHILLLKDGQIFGKGTTQDILTGPLLSDFLGRHVKVEQYNKRNYIQF